MAVFTHYEGKGLSNKGNGTTDIILSFANVSKTPLENGPEPDGKVMDSFVSAIMDEFKSGGVALLKPHRLHTSNVTQGTIPNDAPTLRPLQNGTNRYPEERNPYRSVTTMTFTTSSDNGMAAYLAVGKVTEKLSRPDTLRRDLRIATSRP